MTCFISSPDHSTAYPSGCLCVSPGTRERVAHAGAQVKRPQPQERRNADCCGPQEAGHSPEAPAAPGTLVAKAAGTRASGVRGSGDRGGLGHFLPVFMTYGGAPPAGDGGPGAGGWGEHGPHGRARPSQGRARARRRRDCHRRPEAGGNGGLLVRAGWPSWEGGCPRCLWGGGLLPRTGVMSTTAFVPPRLRLGSSAPT